MSVSFLLGGYGAGAVVLAAGGAAKAARPSGTARALRQLHLPALPILVRAGGVAELAVGGAALVAGGRWPAALVLVSYVAFTAVVALAMRSGSPLSSCGCFGEVDAPPTPLHAIVNAGFALSAGAVLAHHGRVPSFISGARNMAGGAPGTAAFVVLTSTIAYLAYLSIAVAPGTAAAARAPHRQGGAA